jgi:hypothetical protein
VRARLVAGQRYRIRADFDDDARNMSSLEHFTHYTRGRGGRGGAEDTLTLEGLRLTAPVPSPAR